MVLKDLGHNFFLLIIKLYPLSESVGPFVVLVLHLKGTEFALNCVGSANLFKMFFNFAFLEI